MLGKRLVLEPAYYRFTQVVFKGPTLVQELVAGLFQPGVPTWLKIFGSGRRQGFAFFSQRKIEPSDKLQLRHRVVLLPCQTLVKI